MIGTNAVYELTTPLWLARDGEPAKRKNLEFHITSDDYFVTLATVVDLLRQDLVTRTRKQNVMLKRVVNDLVYLQNQYKIVKKD